MLFLPAEKLAEAVGVSHHLVNRWIQSGWLRGVDPEGNKGSAISTGRRGVLVEFESLPRLIACHHLNISVEELRAFALERNLSGAGMKIRYEVTIDDLIAFNRIHFSHSPTARRQRRQAIGNVIFIMIAIVVGMFVVAFERDDEALMVSGAGVAIFTIVFLIRLPAMTQKRMDRQIRRLFQEGDNKNMLGVQELALEDGLLVNRTAVSESRTKLDAVQRILTQDDYTFIYVSAISAHVIRHDAVIQGDPQAFVEALVRAIGPRREDDAGS